MFQLRIFSKKNGYNNVKNAIKNSDNKLLFTIPYTPKTNPIENFFSQVKHYLKLNKKVLRFNELKVEIRNAIGRVSKDHYKNYFLYAYKKDELKLPSGVSTIKRKLKNYKH